MIGILNYGLGNISAFQNIFDYLCVKSMVVSNKDDLSNVDKIILPGVGAFDCAMTRLLNSGMKHALEQRVIEEQVPVLGVCIGMQIMAQSSQEGQMQGLGWFKCKVNRLDTLGGENLPLPHMGWNDVSTESTNPLFVGLVAPRFYFLHSYCVSHWVGATQSASASYGNKFAAAISYKNIHGVQFHPEKSHHWGIKLLENFSKL